LFLLLFLALLLCGLFGVQLAVLVKKSVTAQKVTSIAEWLERRSCQRKEWMVNSSEGIKVDDFSRDQIRMLHKAIHELKMVTNEKIMPEEKFIRYDDKNYKKNQEVRSKLDQA
jgi:hypothetical protein